MSKPTKYIVWIRCNYTDEGTLIPREDRIWEEQGDGPLTITQALRISKEIAQYSGVRTRIRPFGTGTPIEI